MPRMRSLVTAVVPQLHAADPVEWRVVSVADGDTITCLDDGNKQHRIRIDGIDAGLAAAEQQGQSR